MGRLRERARSWRPAWVAGLALLGAAMLAALMAPDFARIAPYRVADAGAAAHIRLAIRPQGSAPTVLYAPGHGGLLEGSFAGRELTEVPKAAKPLDRYRSATILQLPAESLAPRDGVADLSVHTDRLKAGLGQVFHAPATVVTGFDREFRTRVRVVNLAVPAAAGYCFVLALVLVFLAGRPARYAYLVAMFALQLLVEFDTSFAVADLRLRNFEGYLGIAYYCLLMLTNSEWWQRPASDRKAILAAGAAGLVILALCDAVYGLDADQTAWVRLALFVGFMSATVCYWLAQIRGNLRTADGEVLLALAWSALLMFATLTNLIRLYVPMPFATLVATLFFTKILAALSLTGLSVSALAHEFREYRRRAEHLDRLGQIVSGNNQTIDRQSRELRQQIEQRIVLEERERMTRDLHDGLSGQLLSLLLQARSGKIDPALVEREVSRSLEDLRLIAAAKGGGPGGAFEALHLFRMRVGQQLGAAEIALDWDQANDFPRPGWSQSDWLNVMRVIQEAVTNAIRHAAAARVGISIAATPNGRAIAIEVRDDGRGFAPAGAGERPGGLRNMHHRAGQLGGSLAVEAGPAGRGTLVRLVVPT